MEPVGIANTGFAEELFDAWREDPRSVPPEWRTFFERLGDGGDAAGSISGGTEETVSALAAAAARTSRKALAFGDGGASGLATGSGGTGVSDAVATAAASGTAAASAAGRTSFIGRAAGPYLEQAGDKQSRVESLLWAYRDVGAIYARINPLEAYETPAMRYMRITVEGAFDSLSLEAYGLGDGDLDTEFSSGGFFEPDRMPLRDILARAKETYLSTLGVEFLHIKNRVMRRWLLEKIEREQHRRDWSREQKIRFQKDLIKAEEFEHFVHANFLGQKRFSLEGGEGLIPALHYLVYTSAELKLQEIVIGMAHRGRLNVFTNALRKPAVETFAKFIDAEQPHEFGGTGDVKYHLGHSFDYVDKDTGRTIHISLVANPSHLEAVDSVVQGKARGIQRRRGDVNRKKVLPVLIHGDAAFSGQGVVAETFNLSQLKGYRTGGTVHIIINNQIGFTTASRDARSTFFATDLAKTIQIPIFHANGDDPESIVRAVDLAMRWRQKFGYDAVVDILCYRRLGHNEADEPSYTHPIMYKLIKDHPSAPEIYGVRLAENGVWSRDEQQAFRDRYRGVLKEQLEMAKGGYRSDGDDAFELGEWTQFQHEYRHDPVETGVPEERLRRLGTILTSVPDGFHLHPKLNRFVQDRAKALERGEGIDWGFAEALAFATILDDGFPIRLSGEDSGRGTFSHRHAEWWDVEQETPQYYTPLKHLAPKQATFSVYDSPLSEFSVLGFDYGYSLAQPNILVIWEAQFGDFVNGAQVIIDQFISSSESKWFRNSGLVMLLPHGYEGQGPEHSSAHLERFLQLCAEDNMQVVNATEPAQFFHLLRRQMHQPYRKPLIVMSPKSLLRHKEVRSTLADLTTGYFRTVLDDPRRPEKPDLLLFCSGKVYYDLDARRRDLGVKNVAIVRIEQLYPWPYDEILRVVEPYKTASRVVWVQEESRNRGAWRFVQNRLADIVGFENIEYAGRKASPSPATGSFRKHTGELETLLTEAFRSVAPPTSGTEDAPAEDALADKESSAPGTEAVPSGAGKKPRQRGKKGDTTR
ncbi:MAG: 2-oxoglutarate dehydrogenase E1 component [Alkalispirochaeta sp.]